MAGSCAQINLLLKAWLKEPLSKRAKDDKRQTELLKAAWHLSGKVYGYRKLHDDLIEIGEKVSLNRVERLTRLAGIKAQIGYKKRPKGVYDSPISPAAPNHLNQEFSVERPNQAWVTDITYLKTNEGLSIFNRGA